MQALKKLNRLFSTCVVAVSMLLASSCVYSSGPSGISPGYADYWVQFDDWVIDWWGNRQPAWCEELVTFYGDIDWTCGRRPMIYSYARNSWVRCQYRDSQGVQRWYDDYFYFRPGYIRDAYCNGTLSSDVDTSGPSHQDSESRAADDSFQLDQDVELSGVVVRNLESLATDLARPERPAGAEGRATRQGDAAGQ